MDIGSLIAEALACGFQQAAELKVSNLRFMPEVREMCSADRCRRYGKNWMCPPACGTLEECRKRAECFTYGIIVQSVGKIRDSFDIESMQAIEKLHKERFQKLIKKLRIIYPGLLALGAGSCTICKKCAYPEPCRHPDRAVPSMEAYGLWVSDVCGKSGIAYNYGAGRIAYTSCVLIS